MSLARQLAERVAQLEKVILLKDAAIDNAIAQYQSADRRAEELEARLEKAEAFKTWVHKYLDQHSVPHHPPGVHGAEGCRIGDRMDWLMAQLAATPPKQAAEPSEEEVERVAKAIRKSQFAWANEGEWKLLSEQRRSDYRNMARAAIAAMRPPSVNSERSSQ